ncbi:MAG TPA: choice-of-anchor B family protein [Longimicrobiales bacterium]
MTRIAGAVFAAAGMLACAAGVHAQGGYGTSVAAAGDVLYVAEPLNVARPGTVYAYMRDGTGWVERVKLTLPDSRPGDRFGRSVAASGNVVVVGHPAEGGGTGGVHVFERSGTAWRHAGRFAPAGASAGDSVGVAVALHDDLAVVSAPGARAVHVFRRSGSAWREEAKLTVEGVAPGDRFGAALAAGPDRVVVGAPGTAEARGTAWLFVRDGATWRQTAQLVARTTEAGDALGSSVAILGDRVIAGAPNRDEGAGAVFVFRYVEDLDRWAAQQRLQAYDGGSGVLFGTSVAVSGNDLWVGVPGTRAAHRLILDDAADQWQFGDRIVNPSNQAHTQFAATIAATERAVVFGIPDILGTGTALAAEPQPDGHWTASTPLRSAPEEFPAVTGDVTPCSNGTAAAFSCGNVELLSYLPISALGGEPGVHLNDLWGWTDPETGREYALVGRSNGTVFVDVTDPSNPRYLGELPLTKGARPNLWRDIKVYRDHAFIVADNAGEHGVQVFDLTQLRDVRNAPVTFTETALYDGIHSSHNIVINEETGLAVAVASNGGGRTCGGGLHMIDVRDPRNPKFAGCFSDPRTGIAGTGTSHDAQCVTYHGPDRRYTGREICLGSNETALSIADVTDRENPIAVARASYPNVQYSHQGWLSDDHRYFYMNDEGDEVAGVVPRTRTIIWDLTELDDPVVAGEFLGTSPASDHNLYVRGDTMYQSNYAGGLRIIDISDRANPREVGYFDSVPNSENTPGFFGSWSNYPYFRSGTIVFTSIREGLFIVRMSRPVF